MKTLEQFHTRLESVPLYTTSLLEDLGEMKGRQELYTKQSPQKLKVLRESAVIESALASNRIEGVEIDRSRINAVLRSNRHLQDRDEEEVRNYQKTLNLIHGQSFQRIPETEWVRKLHGITRNGIWDAGAYKEKDGDIIERLPEGGERIRFRTVPAKETSNAMEQWASLSDGLTRVAKVPGVVLLAAANLDFLCIHPFRDGNGRVSRLLLLDGLYRNGYEVGRYISIERLIEQSKDRYYETLEISSGNWHEGAHDPWPYINYLLYTFKEAYNLFEERLGQVKAPQGEKTQLVVAAISNQQQPFAVSALATECPGVSVDLIRKVLKDLSEQKRVECTSKGRFATWTKTGEGWD